MDQSRRPGFQFTLPAVFGLTALSAAVFAAFRWLGLEPRTSLFVVAVLVMALAGAVSLVVAIGRYGIEAGDEGADGNTVASGHKEPGDVPPE